MIIDAYIARTYLTSYLLLLLAGFLLYVFGDVLMNFDEFTEDRSLSTFEILRTMGAYYGFNFPLFFAQLAGPGLTFAAAFTFAMMLRNNEMTALVAAGMPLQRLAWPVLACTLPIVAVWIANNELLIPRIANRIVRQHDELKGSRHSGVPFARDARGTILHAADFSPHDGEMRNVSFIEPGADGSPGALITADRAVYDPERGTWRLEDFARRISMSGGDDDGLAGSVRSGGVDEYPFEMTPDQILLRQSSQWGEMMSMRQMSALIAETDLPNRPSIVKSFDIRFSKPLLFWILLLITIPYFLTCEPTNVIVAGGRALLIGGICFGVTFVIQSLPPDAWPGRFGTAIPVLVFGPWALLKMANLRT